MAALNLERPPGKDGVGPLPLFHDVVGQLLLLRDPVPNCQAWIATLGSNAAPPGFANTSFMVYATGRQEAEHHIHSILRALQPGKPPLVPGAISWRPAPKQQQPVGPVRPGIQSVTA